MSKHLLSNQNIAIALLIATSFTVFSCKKEKITDAVDNLQALKAQAQAEQSLAVVVEMIQEEISQLPALNSGLNGAAIGQCPAVTISGNGFPATLKIDFGGGCTSPKGYQVSGLIEGTVSGKTDSTGAIIQVELSGVTVNGNSVSGKITLKTTGENGAAQQNLAVSITNFVVKTADNATVQLSLLEGTRIQTAGQATTPKTGGPAALNDDAFEIAFSGTGTDAEGKSFTLETTTPLQRTYNCRYILSGVVKYSVLPLSKTADYGDGSCDNKLEVTVGGVTKTVLLP